MSVKYYNLACQIGHASECPFSKGKLGIMESFNFQFVYKKLEPCAYREKCLLESMFAAFLFKIFP